MGPTDAITVNGRALSELIREGTANFSMSGNGVTTFSTSRFIQPVMVAFKPLPDITAYELAQLLPFLMRRDFIMPSDVPTDPALLRHLEVHDPNPKAPA